LPIFLVPTTSPPDETTNSPNTPEESSSSATPETPQRTTQYSMETTEAEEDYGSGTNETTLMDEESLEEKRGVVVTSVVVVVVLVPSVSIVVVFSVCAFFVYKRHKDDLSGEETVYYTEQGTTVFNENGERTKEKKHSDTKHQINGGTEARYETIREDQGISSSLQTYEPMTEMIKTSQSNLIKAVEGGIAGESNFIWSPE